MEHPHDKQARGLIDVCAPRNPCCHQKEKMIPATWQQGAISPTKPTPGIYQNAGGEPATGERFRVPAVVVFFSDPCSFCHLLLFSLLSLSRQNLGVFKLPHHLRYTRRGRNLSKILRCKRCVRRTGAIANDSNEVETEQTRPGCNASETAWASSPGQDRLADTNRHDVTHSKIHAAGSKTPHA